VKAQARCQVIIEIGVVHHVQTPKSWNCMMEHMLQVDGKIEGDHAYGDFKPVRQIDVVEQPPLTLICQKRHCSGKNREKQAHREGIEADNHKVCKPSARLGGGQGPTRCMNFANGNYNKDSEKKSQANCYFSVH